MTTDDDTPNPAGSTPAGQNVEDGTYAHPADAQTRDPVYEGYGAATFANEVDKPFENLPPGPTEAERAAAREKLIAEANEATRLYNEAVLRLEVAEQAMRSVQWMYFQLSLDDAILSAITDAIAALPADATVQQIELARARANRDAKRKIAADPTIADAEHVKAVVMAALEGMHETKRLAEDARRKVQDEIPGWFLPAMLGLGGGLWLSSMLGLKRKK